MNLICEEQRYEFHSERSQTEAGVACAIPLKRAVKSNIEVKISDRMGHCCLLKQLTRNSKVTLLDVSAHRVSLSR